MKENRRMSICNRLDLQTLGSQLVMPKNLLDHWEKPSYYTKYCIWCHLFYLSCSILTVNRPRSVTDTKCKPNILCHSSFKKNGDLQIYSAAITIT